MIAILIYVGQFKPSIDPATHVLDLVNESFLLILANLMPIFTEFVGPTCSIQGRMDLSRPHYIASTNQLSFNYQRDYQVGHIEDTQVQSQASTKTNECSKKQASVFHFSRKIQVT